MINVLKKNCREEWHVWFQVIPEKPICTLDYEKLNNICKTFMEPPFYTQRCMENETTVYLIRPDFPSKVE